MKKIFYAAALLILTTGILTSCEKIDPPVISNVEIGMDNSKWVNIGGDLHLEAEIVAEGKIASIRLVIHPEGEGEHAPSTIETGTSSQTESWEVDSVYTTAYAGLKNTTFHEHIEVSEVAEAGHYHLHLYVTDMDGNQSMIEEEIEVRAN